MVILYLRQMAQSPRLVAGGREWEAGRDPPVKKYFCLPFGPILSPEGTENVRHECVQPNVGRGQFLHVVKRLWSTNHDMKLCFQQCDNLRVLPAVLKVTQKILHRTPPDPPPPGRVHYSAG